MDTPSSRIQDSLITTGFSVAICTGVHLVVKPIWRKAVGEKKYTSLKKRERIYLAEKTVSSLNAIVTGGLALYAITSGSYAGDVVYPYPKAAHYALAFVCGYSLYDTTVMALGAHEPPIMWAHHILGLGGAFAMMCYRELSFFPVAFAVSELTVLPINLVWYLNKLGISRKSRRMRAALLARAIAFLTLRAPIGLLTFAYAHTNTKGGLQALWRRLFVNKEVNQFVSRAAAFNVSAFTIMNLLWTYQAVKVAMQVEIDSKEE